MNSPKEELYCYYLNLIISSKFSVFSSYSNFDQIKFYGNYFDFGDFDRCMEVHHSYRNSTLMGKYCLVQYESTEIEITSILPCEFQIILILKCPQASCS